MLVFLSHGFAEAAKRLARLDWPACRVPYAIGDDQRVAGVLREQLVGLNVQRIREGIPHDLVDADQRIVLAVFSVERAAETDQKHGFTADGVRIDRAVKRNRNACLQAEAIQRVDHVKIFAVGDAKRAVEVREVHPASGVMRSIRDGEGVRGERSGVGMRQVEERANGSGADTVRTP